MARVDYTWVLQTTFVLAMLLGVPLIAVVSLAVEVPTWNERATFAIRAGAMVWVAFSLATVAYDRWWR